MAGFLYFMGSIVIILSFISTALMSNYAVIIFPVIFALGCIILGIGKIINLLKDKQKIVI